MCVFGKRARGAVNGNFGLVYPQREAASTWGTQGQVAPTLEESWDLHKLGGVLKRGSSLEAWLRQPAACWTVPSGWT